MGKVYKHKANSPQVNRIMDTATQPNYFSLPEAKAIPLDQFDLLLKSAEQLIQNSRHSEALPILQNLEVTRFDFLQVHELLADVFLKLDQLELAKEQLEICAQLLKKETVQNIFSLKSFDQLLAEAGDFDSLTEEFNTISKSEITEQNIHQGTKVALNLATHHIAQKEYAKAEKLLIEYRDKYVQFLESHDE